MLNVTDGYIPSDMATGNPEQIEEERRLLYVAMTRAKQHLHLIMPARFFRNKQTRYGHVFSCPTRFIPDSILENFDRTAWPEITDATSYHQTPAPTRVDLTALCGRDGDEGAEAASRQLIRCRCGRGI